MQRQCNIKEHLRGTTELAMVGHKLLKLTRPGQGTSSSAKASLCRATLCSHALRGLQRTVDCGGRPQIAALQWSSLHNVNMCQRWQASQTAKLL